MKAKTKQTIKIKTKSQIGKLFTNLLEFSNTVFTTKNILVFIKPLIFFNFSPVLIFFIILFFFLILQNLIDFCYLIYFLNA